MRNSRAVKTFANNSAIEERRFLFEVSGIANQADNGLNYPVRQSGNTFIAVPYSRMNYEMNRINRLGGEIVNISPVGIVAPLAGATTGNTDEA